MQLQQRIHNLPLDLVRYIIPFTYSPTNKHILNDIINFHKTKQVLLNLYFDFWIIKLHDIEPEDKYWLINDIYRYYNNKIALMHGYVDDFYNKFRRNILLHTKTKEEIDKYFNWLKTKNANTQINILWGVLSSEERNFFVSNFAVNY